MTGLSMRHLRYFEALAQHGHFGRAAEACAISQPALSLQMKELEDMLGAPLVERGTRQIRLTSLGEAFVERARDILRAVDELGDLVRTSLRPLTGRLAHRRHPDRRPLSAARDHPRAGGALPRARPAAARGGDAQARRGPARRPPGCRHRRPAGVGAVAARARRCSRRSSCWSARRRMRTKPVPNPETLREMRLLLLEEGHCFRDQALSFCKMPSSATRDLMEGSSLSTLVQMVGAGIGVTLIPEMAIAIETRSAAVSVARLGQPRPTRTLGMVWRRTNPLSDQFAHIAETVRETVRQCALPHSAPHAG